MRFNYDRSLHHYDSLYKQWTIKLSLADKVTWKKICEQLELAYFTYSHFSHQRRLVRVCALSQTRLTFKILEILKFHIISHFSDQRRLRWVCALSHTRLSFKTQKISKFHIISHFSDQRRLRRVCALSQTRLTFKIQEISKFYIVYHVSDQGDSGESVHCHKLDWASKFEK